MIVRRIFSDYAAGDSITTIAKRLNAEGVPSPAPYRGQRHPSWAPSAISVMLHNDRYSGTMVWNRTGKVRAPGTGRRIQRLRPRGDWAVVESPHIRIVPDEIWRAVVKRLASVNATFSSGPGRRPLFAIVHGTLSLLRHPEVRSLWLERRSHLGSRRRGLGEVRLPTPSESWHLCHYAIRSWFVVTS